MLSGSLLCERLPHARAMCLLECVVEWDENSIRCTATSHRDPDNPLRNGAGLHAVSGVEYAAQAMALHGSLVFSDPAPRAGYLASLRDVKLGAEWLNDFEGLLDITARKIGGDSVGALYAFRIESDRRLLLSGRAAVVYKNRDRSA